MRTPDIEGVATRDGPESCVVAREGAGEARTGVRAGRVLSREITQIGEPTSSQETEGNTVGTNTARCSPSPRGLIPSLCQFVRFGPHSCMRPPAKITSWMDCDELERWVHDAPTKDLGMALLHDQNRRESSRS